MKIKINEITYYAEMATIIDFHDLYEEFLNWYKNEVITDKDIVILKDGKKIEIPIPSEEEALDIYLNENNTTYFQGYTFQYSEDSPCIEKFSEFIFDLLYEAEIDLLVGNRMLIDHGMIAERKREVIE